MVVAAERMRRVGRRKGKDYSETTAAAKTYRYEIVENLGRLSKVDRVEDDHIVVNRKWGNLIVVTS